MVLGSGIHQSIDNIVPIVIVITPYDQILKSHCETADIHVAI